MRIGGIIPSSLVDWDGKIVCTLFTIGCNFRCWYCHNPSLVLGNAGEISEEKVFLMLNDLKGWIDGVCVTGGEPTIHGDIVEFLTKIKELEYKIKVDTNGSHPEVLENILQEELADYIAMDIKAPMERYEEVVGVKVDTARIEKSISLIMESGVDHEFRTTMIPELDIEDYIAIAKMIEGAKRYSLQFFRMERGVLNPKKIPAKIMMDESKAREIKRRIEEIVGEVRVK